MLESIMSWNWGTIFLGAIVILSFVNMLALNHIVAWQTMNQHQRSLTHKKIEEMLDRVNEISVDIDNIKGHTEDIKDNTTPPLPPITEL
jgi:hypothetical protein